MGSNNFGPSSIKCILVLPDYNAMLRKRLDDRLCHGAVVGVGPVGVEEGDPRPVVLQEERGGGLGRQSGRGAGAGEGGVEILSGKFHLRYGLPMDATCRLSFALFVSIWTPQYANFQVGGIRGRA